MMVQPLASTLISALGNLLASTRGTLNPKSRLPFSSRRLAHLFTMCQHMVSATTETEVRCRVHN
jgi:hypothetical protein